MLPSDSREIRFMPEPHCSAVLEKYAAACGVTPAMIVAALLECFGTEGNIFRQAERVRRDRRDRAAALVSARKERHAEGERRRRREAGAVATG